MPAMGFKSLYYDYLCCFCTVCMGRHKFWKDYKKALANVETDMKQQMDLVKLI